MADNTINNNPNNSFTLEEAMKPSSGVSKKTSSTQLTKNNMGQQEFLTLLVNQLQNQDPLNPMSNEEFAVQLAQFSQLEQLIGINSKLDNNTKTQNNNINQMSSMASFLGHKVALNANTTNIKNGSASSFSIDIPEGTQSARVDLKNENGETVLSKEIKDIQSGSQSINLKDLEIADGKYLVRVVSVDSSGKFQDLKPKREGIVEGFVMEPNAALLVDGEEISLDEVVKVTLNK